MRRKKWHYSNPPIMKKEYGDWKVLGPPLPYISESVVHGKGKYQTKWRVPCECKCGKRDLVDLANLIRGRSEMCRICGNAAGPTPKKHEAFGEFKTLKEWVLDPRCKARNYHTLYARISNGLSGEELISLEHNYTPPSAREPRHKMRKLSNEQALEIIERLDSGELGKDLAKEFDVSGTTISHIKTGKMYEDVRTGKEREESSGG